MLVLIQLLMFVSVLCFSVFCGVWVLYFLLITRNSKTKEYLEYIKSALAKDLNNEDLPRVSIIIPVHNEADSISNKIENINMFEYPHEKIEIILVDDCSTDNTIDIAKRIFDKLSLPYKILRNNMKSGVNVSYNKGAKEAAGDLVMTTDADIMVESDALINGVKILCSYDNIGGVTGGTTTEHKVANPATTMETSYRTQYDHMLLTESALDSTYPGYTGLSLIRKSIFGPLNQTYGSSDGNLSLSIIARGFRFIFVPQLVFHEEISTKIRDQRRQKIRRGTRLLQSTLIYSKLFRTRQREFTRLIFPLKFLMMAVCPTLLTVGVTSLLAWSCFLSPLLAASLISILLVSIFLGIYVSLRLLNMFSSFVLNQLCLVLALFLSPRKAKTWRTIDRQATVSMSA